MAYVNTYNPGGIAGSASADRYSTVDELLIQLPDNDSQLIQAGDIRDSVYTLYADIQDLSLLVASVSTSSGNQFYSNSNVVPYAVGGVAAGSTFVGTYSFQEMFDRLLYPYVAPGASLGSLSVREFGAPLSVSLSYNVTVNSNPISSIFVNGSSRSFPPYSGTVVTTGTYSVPLLSLQQTNTFNMSVTDTKPTTINSSTNLTWRHRMYWGRFNFGSINLTTNPGSASYMASLITDTGIRNMNSGNANGSAVNSELTTTKSRTLSSINGGGFHLVFAWPTVFSGSTSPIFTVNGLQNTAFTNIRPGYVFTNAYGLTASYEVYVSNTLQNSPSNITMS